MSPVEQFRLRLEALQAQQSNGVDVREAARALRRELGAIAAPDLENEGAIQERAKMVRTRLRMGRLRCPADSPSDVLELAASLEGEILSVDLLHRVTARLSAMTSPAEARRETLAALKTDVARREARNRLLTHYVELLDLLTDSRS